MQTTASKQSRQSPSKETNTKFQQTLNGQCSTTSQGDRDLVIQGTFTSLLAQGEVGGEVGTITKPRNNCLSFKNKTIINNPSYT
ncbi:hypothetical protein E1B28_011807 [Marasmius oreades]|uniref:Uncharacterized protein n=1 Tax=Marasmius oreades TaxID=181124 RepID=A0A9P7RUV2_9AGAR|nr:uncharacterized protein E1B28_011807 [Marasmius oreades]KAG7090204.1 hypothetical protein E1B28_011807 [Marasmius oreades]